ncbi:MAG: hypothetical protein ACYCZU_04170 [Devosia sp.]
MPFLRLTLALPLIVVLAACDNSPKPPATQAPPASQPAAEAPAATTPASPAAAAPLLGTWAAVLADCGTAAVTISATRFEGAENRCDIKALADNGDGTFTASLACTGEGQTASESVQMTPVVAPTGEGVVLNYLDRGGEKVTLLRCK